LYQGVLIQFIKGYIKYFNNAKALADELLWLWTMITKEH